jgi:hypothetical protein
MLFVAARSVAPGTKRTYRDDPLLVRFRGEADMPRGPGASRSDANDPKRTLAVTLTLALGIGCRKCAKKVTQITENAALPQYIPDRQMHSPGRGGYLMTWTSDSTGVLLYTIPGYASYAVVDIRAGVRHWA